MKSGTAQGRDVGHAPSPATDGVAPGLAPGGRHCHAKAWGAWHTQLGARAQFVLLRLTMTWRTRGLIKGRVHEQINLFSAWCFLSFCKKYSEVLSKTTVFNVS